MVAMTTSALGPIGAKGPGLAGMDAAELLSKVTDGITVGRVFGQPIQAGEVLILPVARVRGGAGGGPSDDKSGAGGGGGFSAEPTGVYVVMNGEVAWRPAVDVTRIVAGGQLVAIVLALAVRSIFRRRL